MQYVTTCDKTNYYWGQVYTLFRNDVFRSSDVDLGSTSDALDILFEYEVNHIDDLSRCFTAHYELLSGYTTIGSFFLHNN